MSDHQIANFHDDYVALCRRHGLCFSFDNVREVEVRVANDTDMAYFAGASLAPGEKLPVEQEPEPSTAFDYAVPSNCVLLTPHGTLAKDGERVAEMLNDAMASRFVAVDPAKLPILKQVSNGRLLHHPAGVPALRKDRP